MCLVQGQVSHIECVPLFIFMQYPERIFYAQSGVTSLSFSYKYPNLLAVSSVWQGEFLNHVCLFRLGSTMALWHCLMLEELHMIVYLTAGICIAI